MKTPLHIHHAVKVLVHLAVRPQRLSSIGEIAALHGISRNHLMTVVNHLGRAGFVEAFRGRGGGIRLARPAREISLGEIVCHTQSGFVSPEMERSAESGRAFSDVEEGSKAFNGVLDPYSVADLAEPADPRA